MVKKLIVSCVSAAVLISALSTTVLAGNNNVTVAPPIHWGKKPMIGDFKNGKAFCHKKYFGQHTCIPGMNNTPDVLTFTADTYGNDNAPSNTVVTLIGKQHLETATFTVQDQATGKVVYTGPANNREGVVCNADEQTKAVTCSAWK